MRRTELEQQLKALGWTKTGTIGALRTDIWSKPNHEDLLVPTDHLILPTVAEAILEEARR